jgi:hypothetical protein
MAGWLACQIEQTAVDVGIGWVTETTSTGSGGWRPSSTLFIRPFSPAS